MTTSSKLANDNPFANHCHEIAKRFLLTAMVVDDELHASGDPPPVRGSLTKPGEVAGAGSPARGEAHARQDRPLRVDPITWSFAQQGMVCGVVSPRNGGHNREAVAKAVSRADIVILDWRLNRETRENSLPLLERILREDGAERLRLVAFYTGEPDHGRIRRRVAESLKELGGPEPVPEASGGDGWPIDLGACRIVVYAKPGSEVADPSAVLKEEDMANRLIGDFAGMIEGLLPCIVLTALGAVRENVYRVLESFGKDLDPAFLTHRACLTQPAEADEHVVEQIASELRGIMEDAVGQESPAGIEVITDWLNERFGGGSVEFDSKWSATVAELVAVLREGIGKKQVPNMGKGRHHLHLCGGLSDPDQDGQELDLRLASAMSFRQVIADGPRQLAMGTVVRCLGKDTADGDNPRLLLCVTPRCDSVRLEETASFLFLPLVDPQPRTPQLVVPAADDQHRRVTMELDPSKWVTADFDPDSERECILASSDGLDGAPAFKGADGELYSWVGELKAEVAQSVAQQIAARMGRVPLNKSEWLRRMER